MSTSTGTSKKKTSTVPRQSRTAMFIHQHPLRTIAITIVVSVVLTLVVARLYPTVSAATGNPGAVKRAVGRHFVLPADERPAIINVSDITTAGIPFLDDAKAGDKLLVFEQSQLAILYRPSSDRIVTVGPISGL